MWEALYRGQSVEEFLTELALPASYPMPEVEIRYDGRLWFGDRIGLAQGDILEISKAPDGWHWKVIYPRPVRMEEFW